jgi:hypothetical protein
MTTAVCTKCGAFKTGAFGPCPSCGHDPAGKGVEEEARALWLTSHHRKRADLEAASEAIKAGSDPGYDAEYVREVVDHARRYGKTTLVETPRELSATVVLLMVLPLLLIAAIAVWLLR